LGSIDAENHKANRGPLIGSGHAIEPKIDAMVEVRHSEARVSMRTLCMVDGKNRAGVTNVAHPGAQIAS
jgi:hypothetical protein